MHLSHLWLVIAVALVAAEAMFSGLVLASLAAGFFAAAVVAGFGAGLGWQLGALCVATLVLLLGVRPITLKLLHGDVPRTNVDALVGRRGRVSQRIDVNDDSGRVVVDGEDWRAVSVDDRTIEAGAFIVVLSVKGTRLIVERIEGRRGD